MTRLDQLTKQLHTNVCSTEGCAEHAAGRCTFALRGKLVGTTCDRKLCKKHTHVVGLGGKKLASYCKAHARFIEGVR